MAESDIELRAALTPILDDFNHIEKELPEMDERLRATIARLRVVLDPNVSQKTGEPRQLTPELEAAFLSTLEGRFARSKGLHYKRPEGIVFADVKRALEANPEKLWSLQRLEASGGAPDVVGIEKNMLVFADCSVESPSERGNLNYDEAAAQAAEFGVTMCSEAEYRAMQKNGQFDRTTWSWILTDAAIRESGDALRGRRDGSDVRVRRFDARYRYGLRGWRGVLRVPKA